jgi:hypothetical protein
MYVWVPSLQGTDSWRWDGAHIGENVVPVVGCSVVVLYRLAFEWPRLETETSARCWSELSAYCLVTTPRMSLN